MPQSMRPRGGSLFYTPKPATEHKKTIRKKRWNWGSIIWKAIKRTCMLIGAVVLFSALLTFITLSQVSQKAAPALPKDMVLLLKLEDGIDEKLETTGFGDLIPAKRPTMKQIIDVLNLARKDERVKAVVFNLKGAILTMSQIQEVRQAIQRFQKSGKKTYFYTSSFADSGGGTGGYYLASAFDEIWMQPVGMLSITGFNAEVPFAKKALSKVGITGQFLKREEFKNAVETFTESEISQPTKMTLTAIVSSFSARVLSAVSQERKIHSHTVKEYINKGLLTGEEALKFGLIDRLDYADVLEDDLREAVTGDREEGDLNLISFAHYAGAPDGMKSQISHEFVEKFPRVALIYVVGQIVPSAPGNGAFAAADTIAPAIKEAAEDEDIKVIVLRIDSPGGSPSASESIRRAVELARAEGKKVIISMGSVAASGAYWIAAEGDFVFASPGTLTGSIGVIMGKFEAAGLWEMLGVNWDGAAWGENSDLWSFNQPFDAANLERLNTLIDYTYDAFIERVAKGRKMKEEDVRVLAKGRAWTGWQAAHKRLVDSIGGLYDALDYAAGEVEVAGPEELDIVIMPRPKTPVERFLELLENQSGMVKVMARLGPLLETLDPVLSTAEQAQNPYNFITYNGDLEHIK